MPTYLTNTPPEQTEALIGRQAKEIEHLRVMMTAVLASLPERQATLPQDLVQDICDSDYVLFQEHNQADGSFTFRVEERQ